MSAVPVLLLLLAAGEAQAAFAIAPGVIIDPDRRAVYVMSPQGGIDAVDLASGKLTWTSPHAGKPLALSGRLLVAQAESPAAGVLRIVALDTDRAGRATTETDVEMASDVRASIDDGLGTSFEATARDHEGDVIVAWRFVRRHIGGALRPGETRAERAAEGAVRVEIGTGRAKTLAPSDLPPPPAARLPDKVQGLVASGALPRPPWRAGRVLAATEQAGECLVLRRWDGESGEPLAEASLACGAIVAQVVSADGRHVLVSTHSEEKDAASAPYRWSIYSVETARRMGEVRSRSSAEPFVVWDSRLVHEARPYGRLVDGKWVEDSRRLVVTDLRSRTEVWSRPLREIAYRGPYPPGEAGRPGSGGASPGPLLRRSPFP